MCATDLERVLEIAAGLKEAPHWAPAAYVAALNPENRPRRIALVVEEISDCGVAEKGRTAGPKEDTEEGPVSEEIIEEHTSGAKAHIDLIGFVPGMNPRPTAQTSFPSGAKALNSIARSAARLKSCPDTPCHPEEVLPQPVTSCPDARLSGIESEASFYAHGEMWPVRGSERVLGFAIAGVVVPEAELETIAITPERQRCGLGVLLLRALADELRKELVRELRLEVRASNHMALGFYSAQGFEETARRPRYYADPEEDAVLMRLTLE
jgi:ribosomal-protein-alanine acetyltransferase